MYAVINTGGKQYRVAEGQILKVEKIEAGEGSTVEFDKVLMVSDGDDIKIGTPYVEGGKVSAIIKSNGRLKKIKVLKFHRRKNYRKQMGHRQYFTELQITGITAD